MPIPIDLQPIPNQSFSIRLDDQRYNLQFNDLAEGCLCVTVDINDQRVVSGLRCVFGRLVLPYRYMEKAGGNFYFDTPNEEIPSYEKFGDTHFLYYLTVDELGALRE